MEIRILLIIFQMKERRGKQPQEVKDIAILGAEWATEHRYPPSPMLQTSRYTQGCDPLPQ